MVSLAHFYFSLYHGGNTTLGGQLCKLKTIQLNEGDSRRPRLGVHGSVLRPSGPSARSALESALLCSMQSFMAAINAQGAIEHVARLDQRVSAECIHLVNFTTFSSCKLVTVVSHDSSAADGLQSTKDRALRPCCATMRMCYWPMICLFSKVVSFWNCDETALSIPILTFGVRS